MPKFSRQTVDAFQEKLGEIDDAWQDEFNLYETVRQSFEAIQRARTYKATWEQIANLLMEVSDSEASISPESIRQYYYEFTNKPELLGKKKKTKLPKPKRQKSDTLSPHQEDSAKIIQSTASDSFSSDSVNQQGDARSQFNLSRLRQ